MCRIPDLGSRIPDPGSRILDPGSWILDSGSWIQDPGSKILYQDMGPHYALSALPGCAHIARIPHHILKLLDIKQVSQGESRAERRMPSLAHVNLTDLVGDSYVSMFLFSLEPF